MIVVVNLIYPSVKDEPARLTRYSLNLCLIYNVEDAVVFLACKVFKCWPILHVPFTFKVKNMDILLILF